MKTKSGLNFLWYKFSMELMRNEDEGRCITGERQVDESFKFLIIAEAVEMDETILDFLIRIFSRVSDHVRQLGSDF